MPAGPSNAGLDEPGNMAISAFYQCTTLLLSYPAYKNEQALKKIYDDTWLADKVLEQLMEKTEQAFIQTHQRLVEDELLIQAEEDGNPIQRFVYKWEE